MTSPAMAWLQLCTSSKGRTKGPAPHVYGIALHDTYHTGQIQTLKALHKQAKGAGPGTA